MTQVINLREFKIKELRNTLEVRCSFDDKILHVPLIMFDEQGNARKEFRDSVLLPTEIFPFIHDIYISPIGAFYCSKDEWAKYCED